MRHPLELIYHSPHNTEASRWGRFLFINEGNSMNLDTLIEAKRVGEEVIPVVNLRSLHKLLEVKRKFADWAKDKVKHYKEGEHYVVLPFSTHSLDKNGKRRASTSKEYYVSLEIAKSVVKDRPALVEFFEEKQQKLEPEKHPTVEVAEDVVLGISDRELGGELIQTVDARDLHKFLEVKTKFTTWLERRIEEYGFEENDDFLIASQEWEGSQGMIKKSYYISLDMAKELSMVEKNAKGKAARKYFIECEKELANRKKTLSEKQTYLLAAVEARTQEEFMSALNNLNTKVIVPLEQRVEEQDEELRKMRLQRGKALYELVQQHHKSFYYDLILNTPDMFTVTEIASDYGISAKDLNKILEEEKIQYKKGGRWFLYTKYSKLGLAKARTYVCTCDKYVHHSVQGLKWTQKGRLFIYDLLKKREILPIGRFHNKIQHWNLEVNKPVYTPARLAASIAWANE